MFFWYLLLLFFLGCFILFLSIYRCPSLIVDSCHFTAQHEYFWRPTSKSYPVRDTHILIDAFLHQTFPSFMSLTFLSRSAKAYVAYVCVRMYDLGISRMWRAHILCLCLRTGWLRWCHHIHISCDISRLGKPIQVKDRTVIWKIVKQMNQMYSSVTLKIDQHNIQGTRSLVGKAFKNCCIHMYTYYIYIYSHTYYMTYRIAYIYYVYVYIYIQCVLHI